MTDKLYPGATVSATALAIERAQALTSSMTAHSAHESMVRSITGPLLPDGPLGWLEAWWKQGEYLDPMRQIREALANSSGVEFGLKALRLPESSVAESFHREVSGLYKNHSALEAAQAAFLRQATGFDSAKLMGAFDSRKYLQDLAGEVIYKQLAEQFSEWRDPYDDLAKSLHQFHEPLERSTVRELLDRLAQAAPSADPAMRAPADETVASREQEQEALQELTTQLELQPTLEAAVNRIVLAIEQTKEPRLQRFLLLVCLPILIMLFTPVFDFYVKRALEASSKQEANKNMREAGREAVNDLRLLKERRYVRAQRLAVMATPKARGPVVGYLQFGQVVRVVESERDFSLVTWRSEDSKAELQGWVFTRYLERFR